VPRDDLGQSLAITVSRATPFALNVSRSPFLDDSSLTQASLVETHGSYSLALQFDQRGAWLLEQYTAQNPGRHLAIAVKFGDKLEQTRWLAAPLITRRIADGLLTFSPDASREEAEAIVRGLNNAAVKDGRQPGAKAKAARQ
jgi:preprotein translocase subunit SecD